MESKLVEALDLLEQGLTADEVAARYPEDAEALRPFLLTAAALPKLATQPTIAAQQESRRAFLAAADQAATMKARPARLSPTWMQRLVATALAVLAVIFVGGAGLVGASASTVPGDALYETKRFVEETRLRLAADPERAANLRLRFEQERINEVERLLAAGRVADVSFNGAIEAMDGNRWIVDGLPVDVGTAVIDGAPGIGAVVQVNGRTDDGVVKAERIMVLSGLLPNETVEDPAQVTPMPRISATPRPAIDDDNSNMDGDDGSNDNGSDNGGNSSGAPPPAQPTLAPLPATATPVPTSPPPPAPTATLDYNDNDNDDDDDDNVNDNDDDGGDDNTNDNDGGDDDGGDDNANDNGGDDNTNDNGGDDNTNDNGGDDNTNDNGGDDNTNDNDDEDNSGPGGGDDNDNDDEDNSGSGGGDNDNDNEDEDNSGSGGDDDNDNDDENDNDG